MNEGRRVGETDPDVRAERATARRALAKTLERLNPSVATTVLVGLAGLLLLTGVVVVAGLFLLAASTLTAFVGGVIGAWLVLVRVGD